MATPLAPPLTRGLAWALDLLLVAVLAVVVRVVVGVVRFAVDASDGDASFSTGGPVFWPSVVAVWAAAFAYHALFLRVRGATPGKMVLNLVVRRTDAPGRLPWSVVLRRVLLSTLGAADSAIALLPVVGGLSIIASLFPYADKGAVLATRKQQTLHDLWAGTQVVQRPRRSATARG